MSKFTNTTSIWPAINSNIHWQVHHRNNSTFSEMQERFHTINEGINMSIILNSASMVEGYLEEKIRTIYFSKFGNSLPPDFVKRQQNKFMNELRSSTFNDYNFHYEIVIGEKLNELIGAPNQELWKDINYLFKLRNIISHSQGLEMEIDTKENTQNKAKVQFEKKFARILEFLNERSLNPQPIPEGMLFITRFFGKKIADYFFEKANEFIIIMDSKLGKLEYREINNLSTLLSFEME